MRVRGDVQPSNAFTLEEQPKKPGYYLVRFFENAQEFSEEKEGLTVSGWEYDEYHLELADTGSLEEDVLNNYDALLEQAKQQLAAEGLPYDAAQVGVMIETPAAVMVAQLDSGIVSGFFRVQLRHALPHGGFGPAELPDRRNHREHDPQVAEYARPEQRPQLRTEHVVHGERNADGAPSEKRIFLMSEIHVRQCFIPAYIERSYN